MEPACERQRNRDLTIVLLAELAGLLACGAGRMRALLRKNGGIADKRNRRMDLLQNGLCMQRCARSAWPMTPASAST
jgi:hypothetical protein